MHMHLHMCMCMCMCIHMHMYMSHVCHVRLGCEGPSIAAPCGV